MLHAAFFLCRAGVASNARDTRPPGQSRDSVMGPPQTWF